MATLNEQIAPEIVQAIIARATARGISVNDYLRQVLGLTNPDTGWRRRRPGALPRSDSLSFKPAFRRERKRSDHIPRNHGAAPRRGSDGQLYAGAEGDEGESYHRVEIRVAATPASGWWGSYR